MEKTRKKYTAGYKIFAVGLCVQYGSVARVAEELGISINSLYHWRNFIKKGKLTLQKTSDLDKARKEMSRLRKEIRNIETERNILKKGSQHLLQERSARYEFIRGNAEIFSIEKMCQVFQVDRSCYYKWLKKNPTSRALRKIFITSEICRIYDYSRGIYGSPRITKELAVIGIKACRSFVAKIMQEHHLRSITKLKFKKTTVSSPKYPVAVNSLNQNFKVARENQVWVSDITYISTAEGWAYLTIVIDLFDRKVIGWSVSRSMKATDTSIAAFKKALLDRPLASDKNLLFHSDRGIQYTCKDFVRLLAESSQISQSMSRKGNCYDNAVAESFFKTLKAELVYRNKYTTRKEADESIFEYIENFYNKRRRHSALGNLTIEEFQNQYTTNT
jgi:putative transposase